MTTANVILSLDFFLAPHDSVDEIAPGFPPSRGLGTLLLVILILVSLPKKNIFYRRKGIFFNECYSKNLNCVIIKKKEFFQESTGT